MTGWVHFKLNGFEYRTNGNDSVEALDGRTWNKTSSLQVILEARKAWKAETEHVCNTVDCPTGSYYVTAVDAGQVYYISGPYEEHTAALADVDKALKLANEHDGRAWFMAWGTVRDKTGSNKTGSLNKAGLLKIGQMI